MHSISIYLLDTQQTVKLIDFVVICMMIRVESSFTCFFWDVGLNDWVHEWSYHTPNAYARFWLIFHTHECIICKTKWRHHLRSVLLFFSKEAIVLNDFSNGIFWHYLFFDNLNTKQIAFRQEWTMIFFPNQIETFESSIHFVSCVIENIWRFFSRPFPSSF